MTIRDRSANGPTRSADDRLFRLRRSVLITPGDDEAKLRKAAASEADVCLIEWEDGVYQSQKQVAREVTSRVLTEVDWGHRERVIRLNAIDSEFFLEDLDAVVMAGADAIMLPKVYDPSDVHVAAARLSEAEKAHDRPEGTILIWTMIETAEGLLKVADIARSHERMTAMLFGGGDLGADLRVKRVSLGATRLLGPIRYEYIYGYGVFIAAARAAKIDPVNMGYTSYQDLEGTRRDAEFSAQFGFSGGLALSTRQLSTVNQVFSPSQSDLDWARGVMNDFDAANEADRTVIVVNDEMTDGPYVRSAMHIQRLQKAIDARSRATD